ncbi:OmpW/AlkL family protein [Halomonas rhizosphaerae]|uniref:OmpW family outer membrane protein n=1 Tax=Halomonas rhizosphaerae TaxID=3043296 RepID=A0ABT6UUL4_9GAMM|nr:OmpW family outer membrane protein [Halomonas rhizosphaerae]MDI5889649.1 OmpW family outer membrane protein [Halomonas rhizosphaerae]
MRKTALPTLLAAGIASAAFITSSQAFAYGAGDFFTRVGVAKVKPKSDNGSLDLSSVGPGLSTYDVNVEDDSAFAFTLGYRFTDKLGVELLAAEPFDHGFQVEGVTGGSTDHLPPTLTLQYYPLGGTDARVQPYAGVGVNYTRFSNEELNIGLPVEFDDSWGAAGQLGVDLLIDDNWALNAAAWYLDIDTDVTVAGQEVGKVEIDPVVVMAGLSFRF